MPMTIIIPDILDEILQLLPPDDHDTFKALSLVNRLFLEASRRRTHHIRHISACSDESLHKMIEVLSSSSQSLSTHMRSIIAASNVYFIPDRPLPDVSVIVGRCKNLVKLDLQDVAMCPMTLPSMDAVVTLRLARVRLTSPKNVMDVLAMFPRLAKLSLIRQGGSNVPALKAALSSVLASIELEFADEEGDRDMALVFVSWLTRTDITTPKLKRLNAYRVCERNFRSLYKLLDKTADTLAYLAIFVAPEEVAASFCLEYHRTIRSCNSWFRDAYGKDHISFLPGTVITGSLT